MKINIKGVSESIIFLKFFPCVTIFYFRFDEVTRSANLLRQIRYWAKLSDTVSKLNGLIKNIFTQLSASL